MSRGSVEPVPNIYDGVPKGVQAMIDDYVPDRPPEPLTDAEIQREALKECFCMDEESKKACHLACTRYTEGCRIVCCEEIQWKDCGRQSLYVLIVIALIAGAVGVAYLYFNVLSNGVALLFADTKCDNWVWQTCHSSIQVRKYDGSPYYYFVPSLNTFVGCLIQMTVTIPLMLAIYSYYDGEFRISR